MWEYLPRSPSPAAGRPSITLLALPQPGQQVPPGAVPQCRTSGSWHRGGEFLAPEQPAAPGFWNSTLWVSVGMAQGKQSWHQPTRGGHPPTWDSGNMDQKVKRKGSLCPLSPRLHGVPTMSWIFGLLSPCHPQFLHPQKDLVRLLADGPPSFSGCHEASRGERVGNGAIFWGFLSCPALLACWGHTCQWGRILLVVPGRGRVRRPDICFTQLPNVQ